MSMEDYFKSGQSDRDGMVHDRIVNRTANRISAELERMVADLPEMVAPQGRLRAS
jgi:hypothetical protein